MKELGVLKGGVRNHSLQINRSPQIIIYGSQPVQSLRSSTACQR